MNPTVTDFKGEEHAAGLKHAEDFRECVFLLLTRPQVVKNEDRCNGRKCGIRKRQCSGIPLQNTDVRIFVTDSELRRELVIEFEACNTRALTAQFFSRRSRTGAKFQDIVTERISIEQPRKYLALSYAAPKRSCAKPVLESVHRNS